MRKTSLQALGQKVKKLRKLKNLKQVELAVEIGISVSYLSAIEQGTRSPSLKVLKRLSRVLGVKTSALIPF